MSFQLGNRSAGGCGVLNIMWCSILTVGLLSGCSGASPVVVKGEPNDAIGALSSVLKEWQDGKKAEDLQDEDPVVIVRDEDWEGGGKLKAFEVKQNAVQEGGNWRVEAMLTVEGKGQPSGPKLAVYAVTVEPLVSVLRKDHVE